MRAACGPFSAGCLLAALLDFTPLGFEWALALSYSAVLCVLLPVVVSAASGVCFLSIAEGEERVPDALEGVISRGGSVRCAWPGVGPSPLGVVPTTGPFPSCAFLVRAGRFVPTAVLVSGSSANTLLGLLPVW